MSVPFGMEWSPEPGCLFLWERETLVWWALVRRKDGGFQIGVVDLDNPGLSPALRDGVYGTVVEAKQAAEDAIAELVASR